MNILVTGSKGMVGSHLVKNLQKLKEGKNPTRPNLKIDSIYEYDVDSSDEELKAYCEKADFVFNLVGVNRTTNVADFSVGNRDFVSKLTDLLEKAGNNATVMFSSSIQASLVGRFADSEYGKSKKAGEELLFAYAETHSIKAAVYRFPNLMGHSRPNYNSAVSTFCWAIANGEEYHITDRNIEIELLYIDDLVDGMFDLLEGKEKHCEYDGTKPVPCDNGKYCYVPVTHTVTLGKIVDLLEGFKDQATTLCFPQMPDGSFEKKLYSLYLSYLPSDAFKYPLTMHSDVRGSFTELLHPENCGQVSVNIAKPGVKKGQHWHNSKWEIFIVVHGHGLIMEKNTVTGEEVRFEVTGDKMEAVYMIPGWTHAISNLSDSEDLVTVMICNEAFNPQKPDTFFEEI